MAASANPAGSRPRPRAGALLWCLVVPVLVVSAYIGLGFVATGLVADPITATVVLGVVVTLVVGLLRWRRPAWFAYEPAPVPPGSGSGAVRFWSGVAGAGLLAFLAGQTMGLWLHHVFGSPGFEAQAASRHAAGVMAIILVLLVSPLSEEALFRGVLYPLLRRRVAVVVAVAVQAAAFAIMHANIVQIASVLPLAALLAIVYERTRGLVPVVLVHIGFNLAAALVPPAWLGFLAHPLAVIPLGVTFGLVLAGLAPGRATGGPAA
ncbi:CPBP family intramembrane metalloprotease [Nocardiopsis exhalans]|uniref:CPBP family intramembrane metalloprotease n=1 Tax=Nocardiopsis exhalans TaxID=163604 RepID=A0ABY5D0Z0_9ACTN|nr:type II CAAX endopeptidase family protein [Nocardiopsis exhalans]USY17944.1 CPBP family intramembrane metalloprotease [Nocardiopsis exhalans]